MSYFAPDHLHDKPTKVRLDEAADDLLTAMSPLSADSESCARSRNP